MDSKRRAAINRANSRKSTGPKTEAGKSASRANALKHGLSSRRLIDVNGVSDQEAFTAIQTAFQEEYEPATVAEMETVTSMIETQWQLTRVRRLLDLAFLQGGDLLTTSKMIDNYSRHQTRLHRIYKDLTERLDDLLSQRGPDDRQPGSVLQMESRFARQNVESTERQPDPGFVLQKPGVLQKEDTPDATQQTDPGYISQKDSRFVLQKQDKKKDNAPQEPARESVPQSDPKFDPKETPGFVPQNNSGAPAETDPSFARKKSSPAKPQPSQNSISNQGKQNSLKEIGFVLQNESPLRSADAERKEPAA